MKIYTNHATRTRWGSIPRIRAEIVAPNNRPTGEAGACPDRGTLPARGRDIGTDIYVFQSLQNGWLTYKNRRGDIFKHRTTPFQPTGTARRTVSLIRTNNFKFHGKYINRKQMFQWHLARSALRLWYDTNASESARVGTATTAASNTSCRLSR